MATELSEVQTPVAAAAPAVPERRTAIEREALPEPLFMIVTLTEPVEATLVRGESVPTTCVLKEMLDVSVEATAVDAEAEPMATGAVKATERAVVGDPECTPVRSSDTAAVQDIQVVCSISRRSKAHSHATANTSNAGTHYGDQSCSRCRRVDCASGHKPGQSRVVHCDGSTQSRHRGLLFNRRHGGSCSTTTNSHNQTGKTKGECTSSDRQTS